jgi:hypothetical protein
MKQIFTLLLLFPLITFAQKIKIDEVDKFNKLRRIETSNEWIKADLLGIGIGFSYRAAGESIFLKLTGLNWAVSTIGVNDKLVLLLDDDSVVELQSKELQTTLHGKNGDYYYHEYKVMKEHIEKLSTHELKSIRRTTPSGYTDYDVKDKKSTVLKNLSELMLATINNR